MVDGKDGLPFRASEGDKLAAITGVDGGLAASAPTARIVQGKESTISGIDPATIAHFYTFKLDARAPTARSRSSATTARSSPRRYAKDKHLKVGSRRVDQDAVGRQATRSSSAASTTRRRRNPLLGDVVHDAAGVRRGVHASRRTASRSSTRTRGSAAAHRGRGEGLRRRQATTPAPRIRRTPPRTWPRSWRCSTCCSGFSVIVSLFGMVNTMVLSVFERTREIGMLRDDRHDAAARRAG